CNVILSEQEASSTNNNMVTIDDKFFDLFNSSCNITLPKQAPSTNNNPVTVLVGQTFDNWYDVQKHITAYAINQDFSIRLHHTERCINFILKAKIVCHHTAKLEHNHPLDSVTIIFDPDH
ncbi:918_t:CDS:2, partial [Racocetra persica]